LEEPRSETTFCPFCEGEIPDTAQKCRHCGEWVSRGCLSCGTPIRSHWAARGYCADCETRGPLGLPVRLRSGSSPELPYFVEWKSRSVSIGLALVLGGIGAHKFYLDKPGKGILYAMFCWTGIPTIIGLVEGVKYIGMTDEEFRDRFVARDL